MDRSSPLKPSGCVLTVDEVAARLRISRGFAYEAARGGKYQRSGLGVACWCRPMLLSGCLPAVVESDARRLADNVAVAELEHDKSSPGKGELHEHYRHE
jgi:hypothetical protein